MSRILNCRSNIDEYFKNFKHELENKLIYTKTFAERTMIAEDFLLKRLNLNRQNNDVMNAIDKILVSKGNLKIAELSDHTTLSNRQLERLFKANIGVSPKKLSNMIRYQYLWQEILFSPQFDVQNAVHKYGYHDQAHLLNDFKKYHSLTPNNAIKFAKENK